VGYTYRGFNVPGTIFNGVFVREDNGELHAFPFQGGALNRSSGDPNLNAKDFQVFGNQFIGDHGAISAYYYHGTVTIPILDTPAPVAPWTDHFDRVALYATVPVVRKFSILGGAMYGWDTRFDNIAGTSTNDRVSSFGWFDEAYARYNDYLGGSVRYDFFDPSRGTKYDVVHAVTAAVSASLVNGAHAVRSILEYQYRNAETSATASRIDHNLQLRVIYIF